MSRFQNMGYALGLKFTRRLHDFPIALRASHLFAYGTLASGEPLECWVYLFHRDTGSARILKDGRFPPTNPQP